MAFTNPANSYCTPENHTPMIQSNMPTSMVQARFKAGKRLCLGKEKELQTCILLVNYVSILVSTGLLRTRVK